LLSKARPIIAFIEAKIPDNFRQTKPPINLIKTALVAWRAQSHQWQQWDSSATFLRYLCLIPAEILLLMAVDVMRRLHGSQVQE
jgi:hypothetical protein